MALELRDSDLSTRAEKRQEVKEAKDVEEVQDSKRASGHAQ